MGRLRWSVLARAWQTWLLFVAESAASHAALCHRTTVLMRDAVACLCANAAQQRLLRRIVVAMQRRRQRMAWNAWIAQSRAARAILIAAEGLHVRVMKRLALEAEAVCFAALALWAAQQRACRELLAKVRPSVVQALTTLPEISA